MLELEGVVAGYGSAAVLHGIDLAVGTGEVVTLLGRNGMGKTTTVRCIMGLLRPTAGSIRFHGRELVGQPSYRIARRGLGLVPEGRQVFSNLTVREHLVAFARSGEGSRWPPGRVLDLFPQLAARGGSLGRQLSGGEQQMLAIGRALVTGPRLLVLDEATEGLAPLVRAEIWRCLSSLKAEGQSILLIDKHLEPLYRLADRHVVIDKGRVVWQGDTARLQAADEVRTRHLGV
jgi:branched-chain amino acid transport system ATP-binding protein